MPIKSIELKNFQSHKHTKIDLSDGINTIIGETASGKSAIARAIRYVWYNKPEGQDFLRFGTKQVEVKIVLDNGCSVSRIRSDKINRYSVQALNGLITNYDNFGKEIPKEVKDILGVSYFDEYDVDELNYAQQGKSNTLLHASGPVKSKLFNIFTGMDKLDTGLSNIRKDKLSLNKEIKYIQDNKDKNEIRLKKYKEYNNKIEKLIKEFDKEVELYKVHEKCLEDLFYVKNKLEEYDYALEVLQNSIDRLEEIENYKIFLNTFYNDFINLTEYLIIKRDWKIVNYKIKQIRVYQKEFLKYDKSLYEDYEQWLNYYKILHEVKNINEEYNRLKELQAISNKYNHSAYDKYEKYIEYYKLLLELKENNELICTISDSIDTVSDNLDQTRQGYTQVLKELGYCPICEQKIEEDYCYA